MSKSDYIDRLRDEIVEIKTMLEPLESGKLFIGERRSGDPNWYDRTQAQIDHMKRTIEMLQSIVDRYDDA
jgi:hypothetical protein